MERLLAFGQSRLELNLLLADLIRAAGRAGVAVATRRTRSWPCTSATCWASSACAATSRCSPTALLAPLEVPILEQQVRIEGIDVDRIYDRWVDLAHRDHRPVPMLLSALAAQPEREPVDQRAPGRLDDVVADADGDPRRLAVGGLDEHPGDRVGAVALVEDADLVVDQLELHDLGEGLADRGAQRLVERVDRPVALAGDDVAARPGPRASRSPRRRPRRRPPDC